MDTQSAVTCTAKGNTLSVKICGEIDHHSVREVRERIDEALYHGMPKCLRIDLSEVAFMDSSGLGLIVGRVVSAREIGGTVEVVGASARIERILEMAGLFRMEGLTVKKGR